jgi:phosphoribosylformylglycinamidine synthase
MESGRNVAMSGARPLAITDCLNYGNPENPEIMWQFAEGCEGIKEAAKSLHTPVVSGNVSLYNETDGVGVFPTPSIATVGVHENQEKVLHSAFVKEGSAIYLIGESASEFGASLYLKALHDKVAGTLPQIDLKKELILWDLVIQANQAGLLLSAKDVNVGGIAIALAKMAIRSDKGVACGIRLDDKRDVFAESFSRAIVEVKDSEAFEAFAKDYDIKIDRIGVVTKERKFICNDIEKSLDTMQKVYFGRFKEVVEQDI